MVRLQCSVRKCSSVSAGAPAATAAPSDETEPFVAFTNGQQQHLVQLVVGGVNREIQLVKTAGTEGVGVVQ